MIIHIDIVNFSRQVNTPALTTCFRFHNQGHRVRFGLKRLLPVRLKFTQVLWHEPCSRVKVKLLRKEGTESIEVLTQGVFPVDGLHSRKVVRPLVRPHTHNSFGWQAMVAPEQICIIYIIIIKPHLKVVLEYFSDDLILRVV